MRNFQSQQIKLSNIVAMQIQTGFQVRGKVQLDSQGNYNLIQVKDTVRSVLYHIKSESLDKIIIPEKKKKFMNKYLIQKNDILYLSKLNPGAFRYKDFTENTVPTAHFYILRPKTNIVDYDYICWVLNQDFIKSYIQKCLKGTVLPFISKDSLMNLKIPLPNIAIQKQIINLLNMSQQEKAIQKTLDRKKHILINTVLNKLL